MKHRNAFTLVEVLVVIAVVGILVSLMLPAVQAAREAARRSQCASGMRQIGLGLQQYHDAMRVLPSGYIYSGIKPTVAPPPDPPAPSDVWDSAPPTLVLQNNGPGWGWAALLLPYIEQGTVHDQIQFPLAVEDPQNADPRLMPIEMYRCPSDPGKGRFTVYSETNAPMADAETNSYVACFGSYGLINTDPDFGSGLFFRNSGLRYGDISDGLSQTLAIGERAAIFARTPWAGVISGGTVVTTPGAPVYTSITELAPAMTLARVGNRGLNSPYSEPYDFFSAHRSVVHFVFADASVHAISSSVAMEVLHALATRAATDPVTGDY